MGVQVYTDYDGRRLLVRNMGPPGKGVPPGGFTGQLLVKSSGSDYEMTWANAPSGTGAVQGPSVAIDGNFALFDGTTGKLIKDSTRNVTYFATKSSVDAKVNKDGAKVLSDVNFSFADKAKVDSLSGGGFRGVFTTEAALEETLAPQPGDYAYLQVSGADVVEYLWDSTNLVWYPQSNEAPPMTGQAIADAIFNTSEVWSQPDSLVFTPTLKAQYDQVVTLAASLNNPGTSPFQLVDPTLTSLASLTTLADRLPYFSGVDQLSLLPFTAVGRNFVGATDALTQRTLLELTTTSTPQFAGIKITAGPTARAGNAVLAAGTVTVANTAITNSSVIILNRKTAGGTLGDGGYIYTLNPGVGFTITSVDLTGVLTNTDTSTVSYFIVDTV